MEKFNYVIARTDEKGQIIPYDFYGTTIFWGDDADAKRTLRCINSLDRKFINQYKLYKMIEETVNQQTLENNAIMKEYK